MSPRAKPLTYDHDLRCPRDGALMTKVPDRANVIVDRCSHCAGLWFDARELERVAREPLVEARATRRLPIARPSQFGCPRCLGDCEQTKVGSVPVDTCTSCHGVWLDAGELEAAIVEARTLHAARAAMTPLQRLLATMRPLA